ncbi:MAG: hypothetical protein ACP5D1_13365 [Bacteroidales bacterium]
MNQLRHRTLAWLLFALFTAYYSGITLFTHTHKVNGITVTHSHPVHPFSGKEKTGHQHTSQEYEIIEHLSFFLSTIAIFFVTTSIIRKIQQILPPETPFVHPFSGGYCTFLLRAPPFSRVS